MSRPLYTFIVAALMLSAFVAGAGRSEAGVDLAWSTTYDCSDWSQGGALNCDGISAYGDWTCGSQGEQITSAANNSSTGNGQRHWKGAGKNVNSGGLVINFNSPQSELWIRWYMRYEPGFQWSTLGYDKILYLDGTVPEFYDWDRVNVNVGGVNHASETGGWDTVMRNGMPDPATGHRTSDGQFHCYEIHLKNSGSNGAAEFWVDGVKYLSESNVNYGTDFTHVIIGSNQSSPGNSGCSYVDFDDVAISNTGYIGPLSRTKPAIKKPSAPANLR